MLLGYHTLGLPHHDTLSSLRLLASIGYRAVALSLDPHLRSAAPAFQQRWLADVRQMLDSSGLHCVVELVSPFLLSADQPHQPTLMDSDLAERDRRTDLIEWAIGMAAELNSPLLSLHSGPPPVGVDFSTALDRLVAGLKPLISEARSRGLELALEPSPGMLIDTMGRFERLHFRLAEEDLKLTLDLAQLFLVSELPVVDYLHRWQHALVNVHLCDTRAGEDGRLWVGRGQVDFQPILLALHQMGYDGGLHLELETRSDQEALAARHGYENLAPLLEQVGRAQV